MKLDGHDFSTTMDQGTPQNRRSSLTKAHSIEEQLSAIKVGQWLVGEHQLEHSLYAVEGTVFEY
jgi:hypothetical protein